jgi:hypothetical protein
MKGQTTAEIKHGVWVNVLSERDYSITTYDLSEPLTPDKFVSFAIGIKAIHSDSNRYSGWRIYTYPISMADGATRFFMN